MTHSSFYLVADQCFECVTSHSKPPLNQVEGFRVFECPEQKTSFCIHVHQVELDIPSGAQLLHAFSFEYIHAEFSRIANGYLFTMRSDLSDQLFIMHIDPQAKIAVCNWELNQDFTILRFGLWMCFSIFILPEHRVAIHASAIIYKGKTVLFLGESGTGKSTHTALWRKHISGSNLLNDDSPILWAGQKENTPFAYAYGAPWSGKTPCYKKEMLPIAAIVRLKQAPQNSMRSLSKLEAFSAMYPSAPPAFAHDSFLTDGVCQIISNVISAIPFYELECLPNAEAAKLACQTIFGEGYNCSASPKEETHTPISTRIFANELFFEQTKKFLSEGQVVRVSPLGNSMLPFLKGGVDQIEITPIEKSDYQIFSIVFAQLNSKYVIHRVIGKRIDPNSGARQVILMGDGNFTPEIVSSDDILGVVQTIFRKNGTAICPENFGPRSLAILWFWARPIRRYLLWLITSRKLPKYLRLWKHES